jgi:hypothetical protein
LSSFLSKDSYCSADKGKRHPRPSTDETCAAVAVNYPTLAWR